MINFFYEVSNFSIQNESIFIQSICIILKNEGKNIGDINYIFCSDNYILNINKKFLRKNYYTDVISFSGFDEKKKEKYISGDIFISIDRVLENSKQWNQLFKVELKRVMIHAILHFLGYDDQKKKSKKLMRKKEEFYLILFQ
ncbi:rRNA maturation RNase YbeY [Blattabacterium sp. (Cryptocercus kyebangensis)]|uniref:rRNA maturation RNase YbeY n=1 Tax=Blattabacterium sp. (Cryptocercus kyebangensis) TaxID=298656 RepID=UPI000D7CE4DE|nr:rRNA maturation RNase YbeY [Blattabacterium sp. (Cryptocercus kyebangensis)]AWU43908.1 rRNA maturation RNase YbeY [Blattabacterium sp. (Cryptocercus kyebangensis)]